ncbi:hypothetical protein EJV44_24825, partial [Ancylobacter aquaticus]
MGITFKNRNLLTRNYENIYNYIIESPNLQVKKDLQTLLTCLTQFDVLIHLRLCYGAFYNHYYPTLGDNNSAFGTVHNVLLEMSNGSKHDFIASSEFFYEQIQHVPKNLRNIGATYEIREHIRIMDKCGLTAIENLRKDLINKINNLVKIKISSEIISQCNGNKELQTIICEACKKSFIRSFYKNCEHKLCSDCFIESYQRGACIKCNYKREETPFEVAEAIAISRGLKDNVILKKGKKKPALNRTDSRVSKRSYSNSSHESDQSDIINHGNRTRSSSPSGSETSDRSRSVSIRKSRRSTSGQRSVADDSDRSRSQSSETCRSRSRSQSSERKSRSRSRSQSGSRNGDRTRTPSPALSRDPTPARNDRTRTPSPCVGHRFGSNERTPSPAFSQHSAATRRSPSPANHRSPSPTFSRRSPSPDQPQQSLSPARSERQNEPYSPAVVHERRSRSRNRKPKKGLKVKVANTDRSRSVIRTSNTDNEAAIIELQKKINKCERERQAILEQEKQLELILGEQPAQELEQILGDQPAPAIDRSDAITGINLTDFVTE